MLLLIFLCFFIFFPGMTFNSILILFLQTEALPPANENVFYDSAKGPATFEHLDCRSKNIASTIWKQSEN